MISFTKNYKSYTTREIKKLILQDNRKYLLNLIISSYSKKKGKYFQIWNQNNWPELVEDSNFFEQKLNYIHSNPVVKGYVEHEEDWIYSSARNYISNNQSLIKIDTEGIIL